MAFSKLQHALEFDNNEDDDTDYKTAIVQQKLEKTISFDIDELAHYCSFASAAYGWKGFAFCGKLKHPFGGNYRVLARSTGTEWTVMDLNTNNVKLPYTDASFDVVLLQLSIDYLIYPLEVLKETSRVLKPNGRIAILFSNRLFLSKAVGLWTGSDDIEHAYTVGGYLHFCGGGFTNIMAEDLSTRQQKGRVIVGDPLYVVTATKGGGLI